MKKKSRKGKCSQRHHFETRLPRGVSDDQKVKREIIYM